MKRLGVRLSLLWRLWILDPKCFFNGCFFLHFFTYLPGCSAPMKDFCASLISFPAELLETFQTLPSLLECSRSHRLPEVRQKEMLMKFQELAAAKVDALQQLAQWWQKNLKKHVVCHGNPFVMDLLGLCQKFLSLGVMRPLRSNETWPQEIWNLAQKWPEYFKHDLFWSLIDAIELFHSTEDAWTAHVLCLSRLERIRDDVIPKVTRDGRFEVISLELEYNWSLDQETTIKEKDEVFIREDPSLKGKVVKIENFGAGQKSKVVLLFDTKFKKNSNLMNVLEPNFKRISIMQAKFAMNNGAIWPQTGRGSAWLGTKCSGGSTYWFSIPSTP